jgi:MscS family membrane protein
LSWAEQLGLPFLREPWVPQVMIALVVTVAAGFFAEFALRQAKRLAAKTETHWDEALVATASKPLQTLIWLVGLSFAANIVGKATQLPLLDAVPVIRDIGVIVCLAWFVLRFIGRAGRNVVEARTAAGEEVDRTTIDALTKLGRLVIVIIAVLTTMQTLGFSVSGLLAAGGIGGIAVGFAAKDLLANFFGGLTIYLDRPFSVGEWIRSPDKSIEGTVEYISWRHTRIRAFNKNPIYVPNAVFTTIVVENPSRMSHRRIKETVGIRYDDLAKMPAIVSDVKNMLREHTDIDTTQTLIVAFNEFADSSLNFLIYTFTKTTVWVEYHDVKQDVLLKVADIIAGHGAEIAFPTRTLHMAESVAVAVP